MGASLQNFPKLGLVSATRDHEPGIASNRRSECYGEIVPESCTPRPSHFGSLFSLKWSKQGEAVEDLQVDLATHHGRFPQRRRDD